MAASLSIESFEVSLWVVKTPAVEESITYGAPQFFQSTDYPPRSTACNLVTSPPHIRGIMPNVMAQSIEK
jgi:hypothetical protein